MHIFGTGFFSNQNDLFALLFPGFCIIGCKYNLTDTTAGTGRKPLGNDM